MNKCSILLLFSMALVISQTFTGSGIFAKDDGDRVWTVRYDGPANDEDNAQDIAVDADGNVYVTGFSMGDGTIDDYATIKYDSDGNELWVARYNGPDDNYDQAFAIALDAFGCVYVTGQSGRVGINWDYASIKYDSEGNELWVARYDGPAPTSSWDRGYDIAVDSDQYVYVTGGSCGDGTGYDFFTIKYDPDGNEVWGARYNGPGNSSDCGWDLVLDDGGNVFVTGYSGGIGTNYDCTTIKYDNDGNELWVARYNGPVDEGDYGKAIALDPQSNVYVTGYSGGIDSNWDYLTIKYDTNGNEAWLKRYNGPGNEKDEACAIAVDDDGNVFITGQSEGDGTNEDFATIKYDTDGNEQWVRRFDGADSFWDVANDLAIDGESNVYVTGSCATALSNDYATIKYDSDGNELWSSFYDGPSGFTDYANAIAVGECGKAYVTGESYGVGSNEDFATLRYLTENNPPFTPGDPNPPDGAADVEIDADLSWTGGDPDSVDTVTYDVYFGTTDPPPQVAWGQPETIYDPGTLVYSTMYYWQIVAWDNHGISTAGPLWQFTAQGLEIIIDDTDPEFKILSGNWKVRMYPDANNGNLRYIRSGTGNKRAGWRADTLLPPGGYDVYAWKFEHPFSSYMATNVHYKIYQRDGKYFWVLVDQSTHGNEWIHLGNFEFDNIDLQGVMITDQANGYIVADAVKFIYSHPIE